MIVLDKKKTAETGEYLKKNLTSSTPDFETARDIARNVLGCTIQEPNTTQLGFYVPAAQNASLLQVEFLSPPPGYTAENIRKEGQVCRFTRTLVPVEQFGDFVFGSYTGVSIGTKTTLGSLYTLLYTTKNGTVHRIKDPLAQSMPLGVIAPPEVYDIRSMLENRKDLSYFSTYFKTIFPDGSYRARDIGSTLEIHVQTATSEGTLAALTRMYRSIGQKIQTAIDEGSGSSFEYLSPAEQNFVGYDSIELMPEVPQAERNSRGTGEFFTILQDGERELEVRLKKPNIQGWGYDVVIYGTAAVNPSLLETCRPDEFLEFIETLHTMPHKPIGLCLDSVLGHADFQGGQLLATYDKPSPSDDIKYTHSQYLKGSNMYGRDVNYGHPVIRAILLEMYRRKNNFGVDSIRVDGGQDFVQDIDPVTGLKIQDDDFLHSMSTVVQEIPRANDSPLIRRLDINIEDGRPWPDDLNWIYNSSYLCHVFDRYLPFGDRTKQWSPLIFAHNVHAKMKWFFTKWDKFKDVFKEGEHWIIGNSTHDNARYFYRMVSPRPAREYEAGMPFDDFYTDTLGSTLPETAQNALNNGALSAVNLGILPGSPMFFVNSTFRTPWLFFRDVDDEYDLKVVADEGGRFLQWYVDRDLYNQPDTFTRMKALGFTALESLTHGENGFLDVLFKKLSEVKTDSTMVMELYDDPTEHGAYENRESLRNHALSLHPSGTSLPQEEVQRRFTMAIEHLNNAKNQILKDQKNQNDQEKNGKISGNRAASILDKIQYLLDLGSSEPGLFNLLLEDSAARGEYNPAAWAMDPELLAVAPAPFNQNLTGDRLSAFAKDFMFDALEICNISRYAHGVDPQQARYNLDLRLFRQANPWLGGNPTNDIRKDFFNRNVVTNGAKHLGGWSDKGDIINANTIYYGWRTNPQETKQIFLIANMEGKPLDKLALRFLMHTDASWKVVVRSPGLEVPDSIDRSFVIRDFRNGQALILERDLM